MDILYAILMVAMIIYFLVYIILIMCCKKPIKTMFLFTISGILTLVIINLTEKFTGVHIPVNPYTVGVSASGGIAGIAALLIFKIIFCI